MNKISYAEFYKRMMDRNKSEGSPITGVIVYKQSAFRNKEYTEEERSYRVSSYNKGFQPSKISNSIYGDCLDGKDLGVRLDWYHWDVDYCYIEEE